MPEALQQVDATLDLESMMDGLLATATRAATAWALRIQVQAIYGLNGAQSINCFLLIRCYSVLRTRFLQDTHVARPFCTLLIGPSARPLTQGHFTRSHCLTRFLNARPRQCLMADSAEGK